MVRPQDHEMENEPGPNLPEDNCPLCNELKCTCPPERCVVCGYVYQPDDKWCLGCGHDYVDPDEIKPPSTEFLNLWQRLMNRFFKIS